MEKDRQQLKQGVIEEEMKTAYVDYAMSVIVGRALPDARDGLKPVQRRILYSMKELGLRYNSSHKKSARVVGEVLGKYHPHGDSAVYDALVRMGQDFSLRYPLIDPQGNFGSIDGDPAAAMRYTEARMDKISDEMLADIDKDTVEFTDNFDGSMQEPLVLPSKIPNLLVNGSSGIAVGMATNIPPHNLKEVCNACIALINDPSLENIDLMDHIKGPDFPTGGIIAGRNGIVQAYKTGRGKVKVKGKIEEEDDGDKLIVTELPYMVNKAKLIEKIADKVKDDKIDGIRDLRDESDRQGMRIVIELKRGANPDVVKNTLFKHTRLSDTLSMIHIALVDDEPVKLTLKQLLKQHINHRREVVINRTEYDLQKAQDRAHILEGLIVALDNVDDVIEMIREAEDAGEAREVLMDEYELSEEQGKAILDMRLQRLASMEQQKIKDEHADLKEDIKEYKSILSSKDRVDEILKEEYEEMAEEYGDERKTAIQENYQELETEDLIPQEDMVITLSNDGYTKRMSLDTYRAQHRGGKGIIGAKTKEDDFVQNVFVANTHSYLLFFTDQGQVYWKKVYRIPEGSRTARGTPIVNILDMDKDEKIKAVIPVDEFDDEHYLLTASRNGKVKKTNLEAYSRPRRGGIIALGLEEGDQLVNVKMTDGEQEVILATENGMAIRFNEGDVRSMGRTARGVKGCDLKGDDKVVDMVTTTDPSKKLLTITENGYGKKTLINKYRLINRGGKGVINIKTNERNGKVVTTKVVNDEEDLICISKNGIVLRTESKEISTMGRNTQGVRIMRLDEDDRVMSAAKVIEKAEESDEEE